MKFNFLIFILLCFSGQLFAQQEKKDTVLLLTHYIYFDFAKSDIKKSERDKLNALIRQCPRNGFIRLVGHTDAVGAPKDNYQLSESRVNHVMEYFIKAGIHPQLKFYTNYQGEDIPMADNTSPIGRQLNRRVRVEVFETKRQIIITQDDLTDDMVNNRLTQIELEVKDEVTGDLITADVFFKSSSPEGIDTSLVAKDGQAMLNMDVDKTLNVNFEFYAKGYFHYTEEVILKKGTTQLLKVYLKPVVEGQKLVLENLYFYGNQAKLLPRSIPELHRLKRSLKMNPKAIVEIGGHINYPNADPIDVPLWAEKLAEKRAKVVFDFLLKQGIAPKRLKYKGYSNTQMVHPNATTEADMTANRRVELKVLK